MLDGQLLMHHLIVFVGTLNVLEYDYEIVKPQPRISDLTLTDKES